MCRLIVSSKYSLFAHDLDLDGALAGAGLVKVDEVDVAKLAHVQLAIHDDDGFASAHEGGAQVGIGVAAAFGVFFMFGAEFLS